MIERRYKNPYEKAQEAFEIAGGEGLVENFIEDGASDLGFFSMCPQDKKLWLEIVEAYPSLLDKPPFS